MMNDTPLFFLQRKQSDHTLKSTELLEHFLTQLKKHMEYTVKNLSKLLAIFVQYRLKGKIPEKKQINKLMITKTVL